MQKIRSLAIASLFIVSAAQAMLVQEKFATDPALDGWQIFGDTNLFQWDSTNQILDVTWDSTQPNSYFYHPLGVTLTTNDSFCVQFDLQLNDAVIAQFGNQVAIGLFHFSDATSPDFNRANSPLPNLFEFDYFPAFNYDGYAEGDMVEATLKDAQTNYNGLYWVADSWTLNPGTTYRVVLIHRADDTSVSGTI